MSERSFKSLLDCFSQNDETSLETISMLTWHIVRHVATAANQHRTLMGWESLLLSLMLGLDTLNIEDGLRQLQSFLNLTFQTKTKNIPKVQF